MCVEVVTVLQVFVICFNEATNYYDNIGATNACVLNFSLRNGYKKSHSAKTLGCCCANFSIFCESYIFDYFV